MIDVILMLVLLAGVSFVQNMFFTMVSRSRNSGDPDYHRICAWGSNGVWFVCQVLIVKNVWAAIHAGQWWYAGLAGLVYAIFTTEGSVLMMKRLLKKESGKRMVGATGKETDPDKLLKRIQALEAYNLTSDEYNADVQRYNDSVDGTNYDWETEVANLAKRLEALETATNGPAITAFIPAEPEK